MQRLQSCVCKLVHNHPYIHTYIHIHTHTHTHTAECVCVCTWTLPLETLWDLVQVPTSGIRMIIYICISGIMIKPIGIPATRECDVTDSNVCMNTLTLDD